MVQGTIMKNLVIKDDTNQRKESASEKEMEQRLISKSVDQHSKKEKQRNAEKAYGKEKMGQEPKHKGFNFREIEKTDKTEVSFEIKAKKMQEDYLCMSSHKSARRS